MNANSASLTWDQYSSNSSEDNKIDNPLITEATQQLFLRKYSSFPLTTEELLGVFEISNYDDDIIKQKLDEKLAENQKNKKYSNKSKGNHKKNSYNTNITKNSYSSKKKYYSKNYNNKHYKKNKKYQTEIVEITDINTEGKKEEPTVIEKEIELNDIKKELSEIDEEDKVTSTATTSNILSNDDNEKNSYYYDNVMNNGMYPSKLFPGVFFSKPIELELHKEKSEDFALNKRKNYNEGLSRAYEYYSSFFNSKTNTE